MNESWNDTLIRRVMKKVEELCCWESKNDKTGFEIVYRDTLAEVEELPECQKKQHAKADVLMRGWWWIPGEQNDALLSRIRESAEIGKNDEVMRFLVLREDEKLWGDARLSYIRDKQIPYLAENGFVKALASEYCSLGHAYYRRGNPGDQEKAAECYQIAMRTAPADDEYHIYAKMELEIEALVASDAYRALPESSYTTGAAGERFRMEADGTHPVRAASHMHYIGDLESHSSGCGRLLTNASRFDGQFTINNAAIGQCCFASDGVTSLTLLAKGDTVCTPAGEFTDCEVWQTVYNSIIFTTYFKEGVGIVKQTTLDMDVSESWVLCEYAVTGSGLIPMVAGNTWLYRMEDNPVFDAWTRYECSYADSTLATMGVLQSIIRHSYDENNWADMVQQISNDYFREIDGKYRVCDVNPAINRAELLASTPLQIAYTKAAASVARRIMACDPIFNPNHTATGHWNFFTISRLQRQEDKLILSSYNPRWSFELKHMGGHGDSEEPLLFNDIYNILQDAGQHLWNDEWATEGTRQFNYLLWGHAIRTTMETVRETAPVTVKAGTFDDCITLKLHIEGPTQGLAYRGGNKEYTLARGVGIIRTVNEYAQETRKAVYELVDYRGEGEGYLPIENGMTRSYEAIDLMDGFEGRSDYSFVESESGMLYCIADRCGIRHLPPPISSYEDIYGEQIEDRLWDEGKRDRSRLQCDINNFNLLLHYICRPNRSLGQPHRASAWHKHLIRFIESLSEDGTVPPALLGIYAHRHFAAACSTFGCGEDYFEEGYALLERAFTLYEQWRAIPDGEPLSINSSSYFADIKMIKGKNLLLLPDGTRTTCTDCIYPSLNDGSIMYHGMTATRGWEWFNGVREQEKFKAYIRRAQELFTES